MSSDAEAAVSTTLRPAEKIDATWRASYFRRAPGIDTVHHGLLLLTNKRLIFLEETGLALVKWTPMLRVELSRAIRCSIVGAFGKKLKIETSGFHRYTMLFSWFYSTDIKNMEYKRSIELKHVLDYLNAAISRLPPDTVNVPVMTESPREREVVIQREIIMIRCSYCGTLNPQGTPKCSSCGANV